jgi:putative hydrolase of the HAD superfamily
MEIDNLKLYGYGIKGYILSMIEAMRISNNTLPIEIIEKYYNTVKNYLKNRLFY